MKQPSHSHRALRVPLGLALSQASGALAVFWLFDHGPAVALTVFSLGFGVALALMTSGAKAGLHAEPEATPSLEDALERPPSAAHVPTEFEFSMFGAPTEIVAPERNEWLVVEAHTALFGNATPAETV